MNIVVVVFGRLLFYFPWANRLHSTQPGHITHAHDDRDDKNEKMMRGLQGGTPPCNPSA